MNPMHLFVYGTLRRGQSNYQRLLDGKEGFEFVGSATTANKYTMSSSGIPFVHKQPEMSLIRGEVFMVWDNKLIKSLDSLEGHQDGERQGYHRELTPVRLDNGVDMLAWLYFYYGIHHGTVVQSGDWLNRNNNK